MHRGVLDALGIGDPGPERAELAAAAVHCSGTEREASAVERRADDLCAAYLLRDRLAESGGDTVVSGHVAGLIDAGLFVVFDEVFTGFLPSRRLEDDHYRADPLGVQLIGRVGGRRIRIGDPVEARVVRVEPLRGRIELEPADAAPRDAGPRPGTSRARRTRAGARPR